jgi:PKD repeat protein
MKLKWRFPNFFVIMAAVFCMAFLFSSNSQAQEVIVDNGASGTSYTGSWAISGATDPYGANSLWGRNGATYTWHANLPATGKYQVYMWWSSYDSRSSNAPVSITHSTGTSNINVDQSINGGKWNLLGTYTFSSANGGTVKLTAPDPAPVSYCADAVRFVYVPETSSGEVIVDNGASGTSYTGTWAVSGATDPYGANSLWGRNGATYTWHANLPATGKYQVYMWWSSYDSRSSNAPVSITHSTGTSNINVDQSINGGKWNLLGTYTFSSANGGTVKLTAPDPAPVSYCADAVRFVYVPDTSSGEVIVDNGDNGTSYTGAWAVSSAENPYGTESLWGRNGSTYTWQADLPQSGTYQVYMWWTEYASRSSSVPITITHANGTASKTVNQQTDGGKWNLLGTYTFNASAGGTVKLSAPDPAPTSYCADAVRFVYVEDVSDLIIDNGASGTSYTGTWAVSGAEDPYGANSLWSRDGATYTWHASLSRTGTYQVYMWWTQYDSRSTNAPITITHANGSSTVYVNQRENGGQWNLLGTYSFSSSSGGTVKITAVDSAPTSYCADAVMFRYGEGNAPPTATINSISPNPAAVGATVTFSGSGSDSDGSITGYSWRSSIDGTLGTSATITRNDLTAGEHAIYFKVRDNDGAWSNEVAEGLTVGSDTEHIYYFSGYAETNTNYPAILMLSDLGATRLDTDNWKYTRNGKTYYIHFGHSNEEFASALKNPGAHIIYAGHANYGLGSIFSTETEHNTQTINEIQYINDDRIFNFSPKWLSVGLEGIRTKQAFPRFWHIFKDGTDGIMPYRFDDPDGDPPYNYYITYRVPGDSTYYKIETVRNSAVERFFSSDVPAWYSSTGAVPNPDNTTHQKYFLTNYTSWSPSIKITGSWSTINTDYGFYKEDYRLATAGTGDKKVQFLFRIPTAGMYNIYAWCVASSSRRTQAPYSINHSTGSTNVGVNQQTIGSRCNKLGEFYFAAGSYSVTLSNNFSSGNVAADAVRVSHVNNPPEVLEAQFRGSPLYGAAPLTVRFINQSIGYTGRTWNFGDGDGNSTRDDVNHTYTAPGTYNVSLSVTNPLGSDSITKSGYIVVGDGVSQTRAEFSANYQVVNIPTTVRFYNVSSGNIVSWYWTFGDGGTSTSSSPYHTYSTPGNYTVRLTVRDSAGRTHTETKTNFIRAVVFEKNIDNVDYPLYHYGTRTILFRPDPPEISPSEFRYNRMAYIACNSGNYYLDTFQRGIMFYTVDTPDDRNGVWYLEAYLQGKSDYQIWQVLQSHNPVFDYYNFNKRPSEQ